MERNKKSVSDLAEHYGVTVGAIYGWVRRGCPQGFDYVGAKKKYYFYLDEIEPWLQEFRLRTEAARTGRPKKTESDQEG